MATVTYADWSNVTLAEYAALDIIRRDDAESLKIKPATSLTGAKRR